MAWIAPKDQGKCLICSFGAFCKTAKQLRLLWTITLDLGMKATKVDISQGTSRDNNKLIAGHLLDQGCVWTSKASQCTGESIGLMEVVMFWNLTTYSCALSGSDFLLCAFSCTVLGAFVT